MKGRIKVNGAKRQLGKFRKQSAYITQKDHLPTNLTVEEYMLSAAQLKLPSHVEDKKLRVSFFQDLIRVLWDGEILVYL